jgi:hypothetical protein
MKGFQIVRGRVSLAVAVLSTAGLLGLAGCGGSAETPKKAAVPKGPAVPLPGAKEPPKVDFDAAKKAMEKTTKSGKGRTVLGPPPLR